MPGPEPARPRPRQRARPGPHRGPGRGDGAAAPAGGAARPSPSRRLREEPPAPLRGRLVRLRGRLAASRGGFGSVLLGLLSRDALDDQAWEDIEDTLITADMGVSPSRQIVEELRTQVKVTGTRNPEEVRAMLRDELHPQIGPDMDRTLHTGATATGPPWCSWWG